MATGRRKRRAREPRLIDVSIWLLVSSAAIQHSYCFIKPAGLLAKAERGSDASFLPLSDTSPFGKSF